MLRSIFISAATLSLQLFSSANACSCFFPGPALSDCSVGENTAALLVTMKCVKSVICSVNDGAAVADVVIDKVFRDNTDLGLSVGDMVTVRSLTQGSLCGVGASFLSEEQWILFATAPTTRPRVPVDDLTSGARRLQQQGARASAQAVADDGSTIEIVDLSFAVIDADGTFSDGTVCEVDDADLSTHLCAGNIIQPTQPQIMELMNGCNGTISNPGPDPVATAVPTP
eukprot:jgi/Ulvmu1/10817/UM069_0053.1